MRVERGPRSNFPFFLNSITDENVFEVHSERNMLSQTRLDAAKSIPSETHTRTAVVFG